MLLKGFELDIINQHDIDMEKAGSGKITRAQAKSKHSNLPEGGVWRTIRGSHVYIKDGKVVAGAGVGKTGNSIKLGKAHLAEHQAHIDKEAKKKAPAKKATASKATPAKKATASKATPAKKAPAKKATAIRKGATVHTSTGRVGKVTGQSADGTKWLIDTEDGKKIRVNKENVTHANDVKKPAPKKVTASKPKEEPAKKAPAKKPALTVGATAKRAPKKVAPQKTTKQKSFEDMDDKELEQAVAHHNEKYWEQERKNGGEMSELSKRHNNEKEALRSEQSTINRMRLSKKRNTLQEQHMKKSTELHAQHDNEYRALRAKHEEIMKPFADARRQSAEVHGKRQGMKNLHERVQSIGGYSKAFEQMHDQLDQHHKTLQDGRASDYNKENAQRQIDRTHSQIAQLEEASKIHGKGEKAPAYTPQEPKPKRVAKPKNEHTFHRHTGQAFEEVTGSKVDVHSELTTYMPNEKNDKGMYNVVESRSGFSIGSGTTKKEALEKAKTTVDTHGLDKIRSAIERSVSRHGQSPSHQDKLEKSLSEVRDLITGWRMGVL